MLLFVTVLFITTGRDTVSVVPDVPAEAVQQENHLASVVCPTWALKWREVTLSTSADAANAQVCWLFSKGDVFCEVVIYVASTINEEQENLKRALDTGLDGMQPAISSAVTASVAYTNEALYKICDDVPLAL